MEGVIDLVDSSDDEEEVHASVPRPELARERVEDDDVVVVGSSRSNDDDDEVVEIGTNDLSEHAKSKILERLLAERQQLKSQVLSLSTQVKNRSKESQPSYWRRDGRGRKMPLDEFPQGGYRLVHLDLSGSEAESITRRFAATGLSWARVEAVFRCHNQHLWEEFAQRRAKLTEKYGDEAIGGTRPHDSLPGLEAEEMTGAFSAAWDPACERYLFHGASPKTVDSILQAGIDFRLSLPTGAMGACAYFADQASYSHNYCAMREHSNESNGYNRTGGAALLNAHSTPDTYKMLVCRVLLGKCTRGVSGLRRPPPLSPGSTELYDSVSDGPPQSSNYASRGCMFGVFDNAQVYPEYVIHYTAPEHHARHQQQNALAFPNHPFVNGRPGLNSWASHLATLFMPQSQQQQHLQQQQIPQPTVSRTRQKGKQTANAAAQHQKIQSMTASAKLSAAKQNNKRPQRRQSTRSKRKRV